jgi:hypothetical protein
MSAIENEIERICHRVFDERKGELSPVLEINSPWMTEMQLAEYWQLRNKDGELTVHSIRRWTTRADNPLPCGNLGEIRRYHKEDVDRWAREEAKRQRNKQKPGHGLRAVND